MIIRFPHKNKDLLQKVINSKDFASIIEMNRKQYFSKKDLKKINKMRKRIINERLAIIPSNAWDSSDLSELQFESDLHKNVFTALYSEAMADAEIEGILFLENNEEYITPFGLRVSQTGYLKWKMFARFREILYYYQIPILILGMLIIEVFLSRGCCG